MAAIDLVVLSSSPPDASYISRHGSPTSPPPRNTTRGALKSGSRAARIPDGIYTGFASSASLLPAGSLSTLHLSPNSANRLSNAGHNEPTNVVKGGQGKKRKDCDKPAHGRAKANSKIKDGLRSEDAGTSNQIDTPEVISRRAKNGDKPSKPRQKRTSKPKESEQNQSILSPGKVTKPSCTDDHEVTSRPEDGQKRKKATGAASGHFSKPSKSKKRKSEITEDVGLGLEEAVKRRTDWTPPKPETTHRSGADHILSPCTASKSPQGEDCQGGFGNMMGVFTYAGETACHVNRDPSNNSIFNKGKEIELIPKSATSKARKSPTKDGHSTTRNTSPPKKKIKTITGLATAQFLVDAENWSRANDPTILQQSTTGDSNLEPQSARRNIQDAPVFSKPGTTKNSKEGRTRKKSKSTKAKKEAPTKLLSPSAAVARFSHQDILFGTSSQLAREESPSLTRDIQQALKASEQTDTHTTRNTSLGNFKSIDRYKKAQGGLWLAANRDFEDGLLVEDQRENENQEVEFPDIDRLMDEVQDVEDNQIDPDSNANPMLLSTTADQSVDQGVTISHSKAAIVISSSPHVARMSPFSTPERPTVCNGSPSPSPIPNPTFRSTPTAAFVHTKAQSSPVPDQEATLESPKPKRPRGRPRKAKVDDEAVANPAKKTKKRSTSATTPRKRASKKSVASRSQSQNSIGAREGGPRDEWIDVDEIEDPEPELSPTPPRRRQKKAKEQQLEMIENSTDLTWAALQESVFCEITKAVRGAKPGNLSDPGWHEKILLYDAINPEALATWLNSNNPEGWADGKLTELQSWMVQKMV